MNIKKREIFDEFYKNALDRVKLKIDLSAPEIIEEIQKILAEYEELAASIRTAKEKTLLE